MRRRPPLPRPPAARRPRPGRLALALVLMALGLAAAHGQPPPAAPAPLDPNVPKNPVANGLIPVFRILVKGAETALLPRTLGEIEKLDPQRASLTATLDLIEPRYLDGTNQILYLAGQRIETVLEETANIQAPPERSVKIPLEIRNGRVNGRPIADEGRGESIVRLTAPVFRLLAPYQPPPSLPIEDELRARVRPVREGEYPDHPEYTDVLEYTYLVDALETAAQVNLMAVVGTHSPVNPIELEVQPDPEATIGQYLAYPPRPIGPGTYLLRVTAKTEGYQLGETFNEHTLEYEPVRVTVLPPDAPAANFSDPEVYGALVQTRPRPITGDTSAKNFLDGVIYYEDPWGRRLPVPNGADVTIYSLMKGPQWTNSLLLWAEFFNGTGFTVGHDGNFDIPLGFQPHVLGRRNRVGVQTILYDQNPNVPGVKAAVVPPMPHVKPYLLISDLFNVDDAGPRYVVNTDSFGNDPRLIVLPSAKTLEPAAGAPPVWKEGTLVEHKFQGPITTGGYVASAEARILGDAQSAAVAFGTVAGGLTLMGTGPVGQTVGGIGLVSGVAFFMEMTDTWAQLTYHSTSNRLLFHNHTGALSILTALGKGYDFVKSVAVVDPDVFGIDVPAALAAADRRIIPGVVAQYHPTFAGDDRAGGRTNYFNAPGERRRLKVHGFDFDNEELLLRMYGRFIHDHLIYPVPYNLEGLSEEQKAWARGWEIFFAAAVRHNPIVRIGLETAESHQRGQLPTVDLRFQSAIEGSRGVRSEIAVATVLWKLYNFNWDKTLTTRAQPGPLGPYSFQNSTWGTLWQAVTGMRRRGMGQFPTILDFWQVFRETVDPTAGNSLALGDKTYLLAVLGQLWDIMLEAGMTPSAKVVKGGQNARQVDLAELLQRCLGDLNDLLPDPAGVRFDVQLAPTDRFEAQGAVALTDLAQAGELAPQLDPYRPRDRAEMQQLMASMLGNLHALQMSALRQLPPDGAREGLVSLPLYCRVTAHLPNGQSVDSPTLEMRLLADRQRLLQTQSTLIRLNHDLKMSVIGGLRARAGATRQGGEERVVIPAGALPGEEAVYLLPLAEPGAGGDFISPYAGGNPLWVITPADRALTQPAVVTLSYAAGGIPEEEVGSAAIYRWDPDFGTWSWVGGEIDRQTRTVSARVQRLGAFTLLVEKTAPVVTEVRDAPDPIGPAGSNGAGPARAVGDPTTTISFSLSKPARVTVTLLDAQGARTATLMERATVLQRSTSVEWDGTDAGGQPVPHGTYRYRIVAEDFAGNLSQPVEGTVTVNRRAPGALAGLVVDQRGTPLEGAQVAIRGMTLATATDPDGAWVLPGVPAGVIELAVSAAGYFPGETLTVEVAPGETAQAPAATLTNQVTTGLQATPGRFSPDGDGVAESTLVSYALDRNARVRVRLQDEAGAPVGALVPWQDQIAGRQVVAWSGQDEAGRPVRSGLYQALVEAEAGGVAIEQGRTKIILDRGLIRSIGVSATRFAPGAPAIDNETTVAYDLEAPARVSVTVLARDGERVRALSEAVPRPAGVSRETWDGTDADGNVVADGPYLLRVTPAFSDGTVSGAKSVPIVVSTFQPTLSDLQPANGALVATGTPTITCFVDRPGEIDPASLKVQLDGHVSGASDFDPTSGRIRFTPLTSIGAGEHIAVVYARSRAGVQATPASNAFTVELAEEDEAPPEVRDLLPLNRPAPDFEEVYTRTPALEGRLFDAASGIDRDSIILTIDGTTQILGVEEIIQGSSGLSWDRWHFVRSILFYNPLTGEFRYNPLSPLANDALHFFTIEATDRQGNRVQGQTTFKVLLDEQAPTIAGLTPADGATIAVNTPAVTAVLSDGEGSVSGIDPGTIRLLVDGEAVERPWAHYQAQAGTLTYPIPAPLAERAQHIVTLDVQDAAGNPAAQARSVFQVRIDDQPPVVYDLTPEDGARTDDRRPLITARLVDRGESAVDPGTVVLRVDGEPVEAALDPSTGQLSYRPDADLALGQHLVTVDAADSSRNRAAQAISLFEVAADITAPVIAQISPAYGSIEQERRPAIGALLSDSGLGIDPASIVLKIDGNPVVLPETAFDPATGRLSYRVPQDFRERTQHIAVVEVKDLAGNRAQPATTLFAIQGFSGGVLTGIVALEGRPDAAGARVWLEGVDLEAETDGEGGFTLASVPEGVYTLRVEAEGFLRASRRFLRVGVGEVRSVEVRLSAGDGNGDGRINLEDWALLTQALGARQGEPGYAAGLDFSGDGVVDEQDAALLAGNFGRYQP